MLIRKICLLVSVLFVLSGCQSAYYSAMEKAQNLMNQHNPWLIPRNHHIEQAITESYQGDFTLFHRLRAAYENPFDENDEYYDLTRPPTADQVVRRTFCGT